MLHPIGKKAYKLKLSKNQRIYEVIHISIRIRYHKKRQLNDTQINFKFETSNNEDYIVKKIWDSAVYTKKSAIRQLPEFYYPVLWKSYPKKENI